MIATHRSRLIQALDGVRNFARRSANNVRTIVTPRHEIAKLESLAEAAYSAMYDAPRYSVRDCYDDAQAYLRKAIRIASRLHMIETAARLKERSEHIYKVYDRQFR
ncbi:MAG: hypothetical protein ABSD74_10965 [Rhizomicrobium sp.]|jgi:hypothetical protein